MRRALLVIVALGSLAYGVTAGSASTAATPTAKQVVFRLKAAGLPIGTFRVYNEAVFRRLV